MVNRIFDKKNVILLKVNEDDLNTFLVDMDIDDEGNPKYCLDDFTKAICNTIPEYVFAQYEDPNIPQNDIVEKLREASHCIYKIKDFQLMKQWCVDKDINAYNELKRSSTAKRGEFGELLLHLILSAFCRVQRTPMRFRADAVQSTTDALKQCIFSYSRGFITTV